METYLMLTNGKLKHLYHLCIDG